MRVLWSQEAEEYAAENDLFYIETSAKDSTNVKELFTEIGALGGGGGDTPACAPGLAHRGRCAQCSV
jgi:hypothetical protein